MTPQEWLAGYPEQGVHMPGAEAPTRPRPTPPGGWLAGTRLAPAASAVAKLHATPSGLAIELDVSGLPPSPPGFYYQAWMKGPHGLVTIGTFHMRGGPGTVELWSAVSLAGYPTITVTREPEDGNPASSGQVVLTSRP
ncbi:MAG TPA: anti-sigma factor [Streptosporangiaceae bacterium]|nr:anti-sigma factor [Streptosporangiaceae bacterium]